MKKNLLMAERTTWTNYRGHTGTGAPWGDWAPASSRPDAYTCRRWRKGKPWTQRPVTGRRMAARPAWLRAAVSAGVSGPGPARHSGTCAGPEVGAPGDRPALGFPVQLSVCLRGKGRSPPKARWGRGPSSASLAGGKGGLGGVSEEEPGLTVEPGVWVPPSPPPSQLPSAAGLDSARLLPLRCSPQSPRLPGLQLRPLASGALPGPSWSQPFTSHTWDPQALPSAQGLLGPGLTPGGHWPGPRGAGAGSSGGRQAAGAEAWEREIG